MQKITGATTLAEIAVLRAQYGVEKLELIYGALIMRPVLAIAHMASGQRVYGHGETEAEALDDCFARVLHLTGAALRAP